MVEFPTTVQGRELEISFVRASHTSLYLRSSRYIKMSFLISRPGSPDVDVPALENRKRHLNDSLKRARKRLKPRASFDEDDWTRPHEIGAIELEKVQSQRKRSSQRYPWVL